jgi:UDP-N-acetyl-2-amino-2-deoxyglucuronate dehydrogenase
MTSEDSAKVRFGVIGCGGAAWVGHLPWIWDHPEADLVAVCDTDSGRAAEAGERYGARAVVTGYRQLLARDDIDAVVICTPPPSHAEIATAAASAGKHILLEKPMARTVSECDQIADAAERNRVCLMPGHEKRFSVASQKIRGLIERGALGDVFYLVVHWGASVKLCPELLIPGGYRESYDWRWRDPSMGGGILQDHLPHYVDLWRWWTGSEIESVCAEVQNVARDYLGRPEIGQWEDFGTVLMRFANGAVGVFNTGTVGRGLSPILHLGSGVGEWSEFGYLFGTRGQLTFDFLPWDSPEHGRLMVWSLEKDSGSDRGWYQVEFPDPRRAPGGPLSPVTNESFMFRRQMEHFIHCIQKGAAPAVTAADGRATLAVVEAVYQSHRTGQKALVQHAREDRNGSTLSEAIASPE